MEIVQRFTNNREKSRQVSLRLVTLIALEVHTESHSMKQRKEQ